MSTATKPNPLAGINRDSDHYAGKSDREVWRIVLDAFAARRNQPTPTVKEIGDSFDAGSTPGETWARISKERALPKCKMCGEPMPPAEDCGGDCVVCMAEVGDPECIAAVNGGAQ